MSDKSSSVKHELFDGSDIEDLPDEFDWRSRGAVSPVKNQGQMGQASIFTAVDSIESAHFVKSGQLVYLSEEQVSDCDDQARTVEDVFEYAEKYPLEKAADYDYSGTQGKCHFDQSKALVKVQKIMQVKSKKTEDIKKAVTQSPVTVAINAGTLDF